MNSKEHVLKALNFEKPDGVPIYDAYWPEFVTLWRAAKKMPDDTDITDYYRNDIKIVIPVEAPPHTSIGPDISIERYDFVHQLIRKHGGLS